jgi:hypothetical protein
MLSENAYGSPAGARLPGRTGCPGSARRANPSDSRPMVFLLRMHRSFRQQAMSREPSSTQPFGPIDSTSRRMRPEPGCYDIS